MSTNESESHPQHRCPHPSPGESVSDGSASPRERESQWVTIIKDNPQHSQWYIERWERIKAEGNDVNGEARLVDAMAERGSRIVDIGSGTGRVGGYLHELGHTVVGIDIDPTLVAYAREQHPGVRWIHGDLADALSLIEAHEHGTFDIAVSAGNVVPLVHPDDRPIVMHAIATLLRPGGRYVCGFGTERGYTLDDFRRHAREADLRIMHEFSSWSLQPDDRDPGFVVVVAERVSSS